MKAISLLVFLFSCSQIKDKDPIQSHLKERNRSLRQCYLESEHYQGRRHLQPTGKVVINFDISTEGKIENEKIVENTFPKDPSFQACILDQTRQLRFGEQTKQLNVTYPINFSPEDE
jgi:TonB family protein